MSAISVSIVIPVYNEERDIEPVLRKVAEVAHAYEVVVVEDGSTDQTPRILARLQRALPIRVVTHPKNVGKGAAVRTGIHEATGEVVLIQDVDLEDNPEDSPQRTRGVEVEVEAVCRILRAWRTIFEVPISYDGRTDAEGKKITWRDGITAIQTILWCRVDPRW